MKKNAKGILSSVFTLLVGAILIYSGFLKATAPVEEFAFAIEEYRIFPQTLVFPIAATMPWLELYLGVFLCAGLFRRHVIAFCAWLFLAFEALLLSALARGLPITNCGCFGVQSSNPISTAIILDFICLAMLAFSFKIRPAFSLDKLMEKKGRQT